MKEYFIIEGTSPNPSAGIYATSGVDMPWYSGAPIAAPSEEIVFQVDEDYPGEMRLLYEKAVTLVHVDVLTLLKQHSVENLQSFPAAVIDLDGKRLDTYRAVNIIGLIALVDMKKSTLMHDHSLTGDDHEFDDIVFQTKNTPGDLGIFRLAESPATIVVSQEIKAALEARYAGFFRFVKSGQFARP